MVAPAATAEAGRGVEAAVAPGELNGPATIVLVGSGLMARAGGIAVMGSVCSSVRLSLETAIDRSDERPKSIPSGCLSGWGTSREADAGEAKAGKDTCAVAGEDAGVYAAGADAGEVAGADAGSGAGADADEDIDKGAGASTDTEEDACDKGVGRVAAVIGDVAGWKLPETSVLACPLSRGAARTAGRWLSVDREKSGVLLAGEGRTAGRVFSDCGAGALAPRSFADNGDAVLLGTWFGGDERGVPV